MADEPQESGPSLRESDGELAHIAATPQVVSVRETLRSSVLGLAIAFAFALALVLVHWHAELVNVLGGLGAIGVSPSRQHRHWRSAWATFLVVTAAAGIGTFQVAHGLPDPWALFLTLALAVTTGSVAYAWATGARRELG